MSGDSDNGNGHQSTVGNPYSMTGKILNSGQMIPIAARQTLLPNDPCVSKAASVRILGS
jgi:hypothetical protein